MTPRSYIEMWVAGQFPRYFVKSAYTLQRLANGTLFVEPFITCQKQGPRGRIIFIGTQETVLQIKKENE
jgi:hypothetical protein